MSRGKASKGGRMTRVTRTPKTTYMKKVSGKIHQVHKSSKTRKSIRKPKMLTEAWKYRDHSPPLVIYGKASPNVRERLLRGHQKMGTYLHNIPR